MNIVIALALLAPFLGVVVSCALILTRSWSRGHYRPGQPQRYPFPYVLGSVSATALAAAAIALVAFTGSNRPDSLPLLILLGVACLLLLGLTVHVLRYRLTALNDRLIITGLSGRQLTVTPANLSSVRMTMVNGSVVYAARLTTGQRFSVNAGTFILGHMGNSLHLAATRQAQNR